MDRATFSWDEAKDKENLRKHKVSFEEAMTAFFDENARLMPDPDHSDPEEERFVLIGFSSTLHLLVVCHTYRQDEREIRLISARRATRSEWKQYGSFL
ncbi:MAG: BrnT family toxin [Terriglobia bacterium]